MTFIFGSVKIGKVESGGIINFGNCACISPSNSNSSSAENDPLPNLTMLSIPPIPPENNTPLIIPPLETE